MNKDVLKAAEVLKKGGYTCVLCRGDVLHTSERRGVKPLLDRLDSGADFSGYSAADKVVGNAAAFLYVLLGVREVYALTISEPAVCTLKSNGIEVQYDTLVEHIINRAGTGICPMEEAVDGIISPAEALLAVRARLDTVDLA